MGYDPMRVLRPGDPVEKLIERALIEREGEYRDELRVALLRAQAVLTGQVAALCMGAPAEFVVQVGEAMGGERDG